MTHEETCAFYITYTPSLYRVSQHLVSRAVPEHYAYLR
jgi:hypothetical protein